MHRVQILKLVQAFRARTKFTGRLRSAQHQHAQHGNLMSVKIVEFVQTMLELRDPRITARRTHNVLLGQRPKRLAHLVLVQRHHWLAVRFLIAGICQRIQRQRVVFRCGDLFLHKRTEHAHLNIGKFQRHEQIIAACRRKRKLPSLAKPFGSS